MWFIQVIRIPFQIIGMLFKGVFLIGKGVKTAAPHISDGLEKTTKFLDDASNELDAFNKQLVYEREQQAPIKKAQRIEQQIKRNAAIRALEAELASKDKGK
jgi:hypothetical protein